MSMKYGIQLPQGWPLLAGIKDPVEAYETMARAAQLADECGYETIWLADHFMPTALHPSAREEDMLFFLAALMNRLYKRFYLLAYV